MSDDQQVSPLMRELSGYIAAALKRRLPAEVVAHAKLHLVDTFAAMISGSRLVPGKRVTTYVKSLGGIRQAGIVGTRLVTSALHAALSNATCAHADETDDTHQGCNSHLGAVNVPAALALAERQRVSGELLLRALVLGYDINARVILALGARQLARAGIHASSRGGIFGAAAAAAALLKLDSNRVRHVLSYCAEQAAGTLIMYRESQHNEKAFVAGGMPAHNGVAAALMVKSGFTGVEDAFTGDPNFLGIFSREPDSAALVRGLGRDYAIVNCAIKYWSAGGPIQAPLHVLREMIERHRFKVADVEKLVVRVPDVQLEVVDNRDTPNITLQHLLAVMLVDGTVTFKSAHDYSR
jgi:2-methylcitrate dehydratase PrpD